MQIEKYNVLPRWMFNHLDISNDLLKNRSFKKHNILSRLSLQSTSHNFENDDDVYNILIKQHWFLRIPHITKKITDTGREKGKIYEKIETTTIEIIDYPEAFDTILFEYAKFEADLSEQDSVNFADFWLKHRPQITIGQENTVSIQPPDKNIISPAKLKEFQTKLEITLNAHHYESILKTYIFEIMQKTYKYAYQVGSLRAKSHPTVRRAEEQGWSLTSP